MPSTLFSDRPSTTIRTSTAASLRLTAAAFGALAAIAVTAGPVLAADDEDDTPFEQQIIRSLFGNNQPNIEYRERSPLVIPPSVALPSPERTGSVARTPAWPNDPDVARGRKSGGAEPAVDANEVNSRLLSQGELRRGTVRGSQRQREPVTTLSDAQMGRTLTPAEMGETKSVFGSLFKGSAGEKPEVFAGEPRRERLIDPPTGYRTPVGNQPYAPPKDTGSWYKPFSWFDRGVSKDR